MAFNKLSLNLFASSPYGTAGKNINFHTYATADAAATVAAAGYFNDVRDKLKVNDVVHAMCVADGVGDMLLLKVTAAPATGNVTVAVEPEAAAV